MTTMSMLQLLDAGLCTDDLIEHAYGCQKPMTESSLLRNVRSIRSSAGRQIAIPRGIWPRGTDEPDTTGRSVVTTLFA